MQTPGHLRHSRLLGTLVTVSVTNAAAASGLRSEETQGKVVPLITANHLLCEVLSLAGGREEKRWWGGAFTGVAGQMRRRAGIRSHQ